MNTKNVIKKIVLASAFSIFAINAQSDEIISVEKINKSFQLNCEIKNSLNNSIRETVEDQIKEMNKKISKEMLESLPFKVEAFDIANVNTKKVNDSDFFTE